ERSRNSVEALSGAEIGSHEDQAGKGELCALRGRLRDSGSLKRAAGGRGQTLGRAIPVGKRGCTITGKNADHAHSPRLRFSGVEFQEVRTEITAQESHAADQTIKEERLGALSESAGDHQKQRGYDAGRVDRSTEPGTERVGAIPLLSRGKTNLQQAGSSDFLANLEMGEA